MKQFDKKSEIPSARRPRAVSLDAWVAARQPQLHPTQRRVLETLNELSAGQGHIASRALRQNLGMSPQLLNRHLRHLSNLGLVHLENPGAGLPLLAKITVQGERILGQRPSAPAAALDALQPQQAPAQESLSLPLPEQDLSQQEALTHALFRTLAPHLKDLDADGFLRLMRQSLAQAQGQPLPPSPAAPSQPPGQLTQAPPQLDSLEQALEERLALTCHGEYRGLAWYERTREFTNVWDRARRRTWGLLGTYFQTFAPRWEHPDWDSFNRARRLADVRCARYEEWIGAQFKRLLAQGVSEVSPQQLQGEEAVRAWEGVCRPPEQPLPRRSPSPPPYTPATYDAKDSVHTDYAQELMDEIAYLAGRVYGKDPQGPVRLLAEAMALGNLPQAALDLRPQWKDQVLEFRRAQVNRAASSLPTTPQGDLPIII
jgi:hypothetical protein